MYALRWLIFFALVAWMPEAEGEQLAWAWLLNALGTAGTAIASGAGAVAGAVSSAAGAVGGAIQQGAAAVGEAAGGIAEGAGKASQTLGEGGGFLSDGVAGGGGAEVAGAAGGLSGATLPAGNPSVPGIEGAGGGDEGIIGQLIGSPHSSPGPVPVPQVAPIAPQAAAPPPKPIMTPGVQDAPVQVPTPGNGLPMDQGQQRWADTKGFLKGMHDQTDLGRFQKTLGESSARWKANGAGGLMKWDESAITPWIEQGYATGGEPIGGYRTPATQEDEELQRRYEQMPSPQDDWQKRLTSLQNSRLYESYYGD